LFLSKAGKAAGHSFVDSPPPYWDFLHKFMLDFLCDKSY
jgi:hypothetical protein